MKAIHPSIKNVVGMFALVFGLPLAASSQSTNYSEVVGYQTSSIKGSPTGSYFNFVPVQLAKPSVFTGSASASGTTVNLTGASLGDVTSLPHYLIVKSGSGVGFISDIVANTTTNVTTADDLSTSIPANTSVSVVPHVLLTDVLGTASNLVVQGGGTATTADLVYLVAADGSFTPYYFKDSGFGQGWKNASTGNTENVVPVYPSESILVERKTATDVTALTQVGTVANTDMKMVYPTGFTASASGFPSSLTLSSLTAVVQGGGTADAADLVYLINSGTGQLTPYYYKNSGFGLGWKDASSGLTVDPATIEIGTGFIIERKQPSSTTLSQNRPY